MVRIEHAHIPIQTYLVPADVRLIPVDLVVAGKRIGYIPGPGDEVPASLRQVGYEVTVLGDETLAAGAPALTRFDAIVVGVRAFNTNERLRLAHAALMAYVSNGGTLVLQYNTNNRLAALTVPLGPWPFEIGQKRVTDETAAVALTAPGHPSLTTPNAIGPKDFDGWVQERGLYFAEKWDEPLPDAAFDARSRGGARREPALGAPREGDLRLHGAGVLPAAAGRGAGRVSIVRQPARRRASALAVTKPPAQRAELDDAPPFLTWRAIYLIVLGALAVEVLLGAALTLAAS